MEIFPFVWYGSNPVSGIVRETRGPMEARTAEQDPISQEWLDSMAKRQDLLRRMFLVFVREEPQRIDKIGAALAAGDTQTLRFLTHGLKGAAATLGAAPIRASCQTLEGAALSGDLSRATALFQDLSREMQRAYDFMSAWLAALPPPPA